MITRYEYSDNKKITAIKADGLNGHLWTAFEQDSSGVCILERQFAFNPLQTFFLLEREVNRINALDVNSTHLFCAYDDPDVLGEKISITNPLTSVLEISKPLTINESPIDVHVNGSDLWFLLPGSQSGEVATLLRYTLTGTLLNTIELTKSGSEATNASSFTIDENDEIWVVTNTSPASVVRVFLDGFTWDFTITDII